MLDKNLELLEGCDLLEYYEGYERKIYSDSVGIETVGIGRNLEVYPFDPEEQEQYDLLSYYSHLDATAWAYSKLKQCRQDVVVHNPWLVESPKEIRLIVVDMTFNLGLKGILGFKNMLKAMKAGDYDEAAAQLKDSKYYRQVGRRSQDHYNTIIGLI